MTLGIDSLDDKSGSEAVSVSNMVCVEVRALSVSSITLNVSADIPLLGVLLSSFGREGNRLKRSGVGGKGAGSFGKDVSLPLALPFVPSFLFGNWLLPFLFRLS